MSAQQLADATERAGHGIPRSVLANLESGRRETVTVPELVTLARVLHVWPIELVFPLGRAETVELLPGKQVPTWSAVKWFTGEGPFPDQPIPDLSAPRAGTSAIELHREHERHLAEWSRRRQQVAAAHISTRDGEDTRQQELRRQVITEAERAALHEEEALAEVRRRMRRNDVVPPPLYDPRLAYIDGGKE